MHLMKRKSPKEKLNEMVSSVRKQKYGIERDINNIQRTNDDAMVKIKRYAKQGNMDAARILAKELANGRKGLSRMYTARANLQCIIYELQQQSSAMRLTGALQQSTGIMKAMSQLIKLPDLQNTMQGLSKEMTKMGIMGEMMDDAFDSVFDDTETSIDEEVDKILTELFAGDMKNTPDAQKGSLLPGTSQKEVPASSQVEEDVNQGELDDMARRLEALRN